MSGAGGIVWPVHTAAGGLSAHAASASIAQRLGTSALDAVTAWHGTAAEFPFTDVLDHFRAVGRIGASGSLVGELARLSIQKIGERHSSDTKRLATWLRAATDQLDGDYHTYAGITLQAEFLHEAYYDSCECTADAMLVTLLIDLLRIEAEALAVTPSRQQRKRTQAVMHALRLVDRLAPQAAAAAPDLTMTMKALRGGAGDGELAGFACEAAQVRPFVAADDLAALIMLPTTPLHDEQMFLRAIQMFECLYLRTAWRLEATTSALVDRELASALRLLDAAAGQLEAAAALYRVLTTMPRDAFAIIRKYTAGRSAIQSLAFRRVEHACAPPRDGGRRHSPLDTTLQEAYCSAERWLDADAAGALRTAMRRVDKQWRSLKRSHWGIALKIIGHLPGTGGTSGADYLYESSRLPLFPVLSERSA